MSGAAWVWIAVLGLLVLWDVAVVIYRAVTKKPEPTVSMVARNFAAAHPWVLLAAGILMGHFFWPQPPAPP